VKAGRFPLAYPTAGSAALLFVVGAMWYAASSQNSAAIYLLLFLLASVFLVSIPHTLINLVGVTLRVESAKPTFAGDDVCLPVEIMNSSRATRYGIELVLADSYKRRERLDCIPRESAARLTLRFSAHRRGEHKIGTLDLTSLCVRQRDLSLTKATSCIPGQREILSYRRTAHDSPITGFSKASGMATTLPESAPMCRENPNVTLIGKLWRAGNH